MELKRRYVKQTAHPHLPFNRTAYGIETLHVPPHGTSHTGF